MSLQYLMHKEYETWIKIKIKGSAEQAKGPHGGEKVRKNSGPSGVWKLKARSRRLLARCEIRDGICLAPPARAGR